MGRRCLGASQLTDRRRLSASRDAGRRADLSKGQIVTMDQPHITLNNRVTMPALGLGVLNREQPELTQGAVEAAVAEGYRLIDTAAAYGNEREVGQAIASSSIERSELFVTTKLWLTDYGYDSALRAFDASLRRLGLDHLDLYLLHWPVPSDFDATAAAYRAAEELLAQGRVRAIGVSNFGASDLRALLDRVEVVPAVNQIELHPFFTQGALREIHEHLGIVTEAWSPLGGSVRRADATNAAQEPLTHPVIVALAERYGKSPAQIVLRWHIDHGFVAIPKSVRPARIAENFDIFDFALTADDIASIDALDMGRRFGPDPHAVHAKTFPITVSN
jgi:diketogulonate reductase-like aldo/keto reductase